MRSKQIRVAQLGISKQLLFQMCPKGIDEFRGGCKKTELTAEDDKIVDHLCPQNFPKRSSKHSTISSNSKSRNSMPNLVYKRRKLRGNSITSLPRQGQGSKRRSEESFSIVSFNTPLVTSKGVLYQSSVEKTSEVDSVNDSCSSSKSNAEHVLSSIKIEVDEASECSSSSAIVMEYMGDELSEKEFCIRVLRSHGLLERDLSTRGCSSPEVNGTNNGDSCWRSCKICARSDSTIKLLICDHCEEAFHLACCNPCMKKAPIDEWFCHSCMKKREQILRDKVRRKLPYVTSDLLGYKSLSSKGKTSPIALMLRDIEPRTTHVRIGKDFQAEVPKWSGSIENDDDDIGKPPEVDPSQYASWHEPKPNNYRRSSVHNWLQCRAVLDGSEETICGKWRRAPLYEVQTDVWECYCSVLWDPRYADCAVPQELKTDEVLDQLKYFEKLRPRLWGKRLISDHTKNNGNS